MMHVQHLYDIIEAGSANVSCWELMIIGGGPVGLTLAAELAGETMRVLVVESGGIDRSENLAELDHFENVGETRVTDPSRLRARALGGTSTIWSGRCTPFSGIDFEERSWVPFSGWPKAVVRSLPDYLHRASVHLGIADHHYGEGAGQDARSPPVPYNPLLLRAQLWQYSRDGERRFEYMHFGPRFLKRDAANVDVLLGATVTRLNLSSAGTTLASVEVAALDGRRHVIQAKRVVLCAGGIENARLLLNALQPHHTGLSILPATGRFLMDHPRCTIGTFLPTDAAAAARFFGLLRLRARAGSGLFTQGVALGTSVQREERLLNCAAWITEIRADDDPWETLKRSYWKGWPGARDLASIAGHVPTIARGAWRHVVQRRGVVHKCDALHLDCLVEQVPNPENRITLSDTTDRFGVPLARVNWKIGTLERTTVSRFGQIIAEELDRLGGPVLRMSRWICEKDDARADMIDVAHPMGTTRMSSDPRTGVVSEDGRVHGLDNLYVAGTSVFPTAGHANPTFMAVALTVRLADHIKSQTRSA